MSWRRKTTNNDNPGLSNAIIAGRQIFQCGHYDSIGPRETMEDAVSIIGDFAGAGTQYYGLFDGHGGNEVAMYCANNLHRIFARRYSHGSRVLDVLKDSIAEINEIVIKHWPYAGCTAAIAIIIDDTIYTANLGDSRILLVDNSGCKRLSYDHKATDREEGRLVTARGGFIYQGRVNGVLAITRAIGDGAIKSAITCEPYTKQITKRPGMNLIIACDGVWDIMSDEEAAAIFRRSRNPAIAAREIVEVSLRKETSDNVSVICVSLTPR